METDTMIVAVPAEAPGGLDAPRSGHFGRSPYFTLVELLGGVLGEVHVLENPAHGQGGCGGPARLLLDAGVTTVVVAGIGGRPLAALVEGGADVYVDGEHARVGDAVDALLAGRLSRVEPGGGCDRGH